MSISRRQSWPLAAGLVVGTGVKMATKLKLDRLALVLGSAALATVAVFQVSLVVTVLVLAPLGLAVSLWRSVR